MPSPGSSFGAVLEKKWVYQDCKPTEETLFILQQAHGEKGAVTDQHNCPLSHRGSILLYLGHILPAAINQTEVPLMEFP